MHTFQGYEPIEDIFSSPRRRVIRAKRLADEQSVIIKAPGPERALESERARLRQEYELSRSIEYDHVVRPCAVATGYDRTFRRR